ncbi:hypothetical protein MsAg5_12750 [Methanosarcinaceae archaeon Ag5]|uniref:Peptidase S1 domain-containing protein n=1 Tax=Methanolapillus africanus TaxID=3028297 RepID=A0AAE4MIX6_9EURY|nr:hypothetical protein [Methanosarcinaceae archaeon Ag5]
MKMKLMSLICTLVVLAALIGPAMADEDIRNYPSNPYTKEELDEIISKTQPTKPELFDEFQKNENILMLYGEIPEKEMGLDSYEWWLNISSIADEMTKDENISDYFEKGLILRYGPYCDGYISFVVDEKFKNDIKQEDLDNINKIVNKYASSKGIQNIPVAISVGQPIEFIAENVSEENNSMNIVARALNYYTDKTRPVIGGTRVATQMYGGTSGFAAKNQTNSSRIGIVTVAHLTNFSNAMSVYQPTVSSSNKIGVTTGVRQDIDAMFVPCSNVQAKIHTGNNFLVSVKGSSGLSSGMALYRSGINTGDTSGTYAGYAYYNQNIFNNTVSRLDVMVQNNHSQPGDSGGPVYTTVNGRTYICGITCAYKQEASGRIVTLFASSEEIRSKLGVVPLTM